MYLSQPGHLLQSSLHSCSIAVNPLQTVHVSIQNLPNLVHRVPVVLGLGRGVQVGDDLLQILTHPGQLPVQVLCKSISSFPLSIYRATVGQAGLQWLQRLLQLCLLSCNEVQLVVQSLLVQPHCCYTFVQRNNLLSILDEELVPSIDLGGLVEEQLLHILQLQGPFVDVLLQVPELHGVSWLTGAGHGAGDAAQAGSCSSGGHSSCHCSTQ